MLRWQSKLFIALMIAIVCGSIAFNANAVPKETVVLVGDSRTVGMDLAKGISKETGRVVVAKDGAGLAWLKSDAVFKIDEIEKNAPDAVEVYLLGVNDPHNKDAYTEWYKERAKNHRVIVVSVNPVDKCNVTNADVQAFNRAIQKAGLEYIDTNSALSKIRTESKLTVDGLHYNKETYEIIYNIVSLYLKGKS